MSAPRFGLRVLPTYPHGPQYVGEVATYGNSSQAQVEQIREDMTTGEFYEVVERGADGQWRVIQ